jgi:hypothetical protein
VAAGALFFSPDGLVLLVQPTYGELDRISLAADEIEEWRLVAPNFLNAHLNDRLARRVHTALGARERGRAAYAEHGTEAPT